MADRTRDRLSTADIPAHAHDAGRDEKRFPHFERIFNYVAELFARGNTPALVRRAT
jgi:hypothetical protein